MGTSEADRIELEEVRQTLKTLRELRMVEEQFVAQAKILEQAKILKETGEIPGKREIWNAISRAYESLSWLNDGIFILSNREQQLIVKST